MNPPEIHFLTTAWALKIHEEQVTEFGGSPELRDLGLLESALAQAQASFFGEYLHPFPFGMAAAYLYHVVSNHPFVDGNKRAGYMMALLFLGLNGVRLPPDAPQLYELTMGIAEGRLHKAHAERVLRESALPEIGPESRGE